MLFYHYLFILFRHFLLLLLLFLLLLLLLLLLFIIIIIIITIIINYRCYQNIVNEATLAQGCRNKEAIQNSVLVTSVNLSP